MGIARGPNLIKDNLVFGFDTGYGVADNFTATRFYPGEPTDNLLYKTGAVNLATGTDIYVNAVKTSLGNGRYKFVNDGTGGTTVRLYCNLSDLTDGQSYAISLFYEDLVGSLSADWCDTSITSYNNNNGKIIGIGTRSTYTSTYRFLDISLSSGGSVILSKPQIGSNSHVTPYISGTRSSTASLIDLKRTTNIDVANVSFDSTGQPEFDGTDDYIPLTGILNNEDIGASTAYTVDMWLKPGVYSSRMPFSTGQNGNNRIYYWTDNGLNTWRIGNYTSTSGHGTLPTVGTWYNTTLVINGTNITVYLNGEEDYTGSYTTFNTQHYATFGRHGASTSYYYTGKIAVARLHERVLSADEVKQNYNAQKNRFNI
jgi:hypothetical protein